MDPSGYGRASRLTSSTTTGPRPPAQPNAGAPQGDGWPTGIRHDLAVVPAIQALAGIPNAAIIARGYAVAVIAFGASQTTVTFLTVATGGAPGTADAIANITVLGNPFGAASTVAQSTDDVPAVLLRGHDARHGPALGGVEGDRRHRHRRDLTTPGRGRWHRNMTYLHESAARPATRTTSCSRRSATMTATASTTARTTARRSLTRRRPNSPASALACNAGQGYDNNNACAHWPLLAPALRHRDHLHRHRRRRVPELVGQLPVRGEPDAEEQRRRRPR